ncbi:TadE family type IV pilus minor pilin [Cellulomonas sp. S1-8]|uniref:TadE family type IV pilus minor pilin n=1 Tax=Cellulomonas sp. S1-8 TaxID=2904790 RepID=UPI002242CA7E|nr:TadE family type IV pilus minor pilin [Cellulomonas sp. S1-8]UZN02435.1 TadE family protein [Cellulomonas sp. S1-8]
MSGRRRGPQGVAGRDAAPDPAGALADRGAVTAELAVGMVAVAAVLAAVLATGSATLVRLTCLDAARTAARVAALGEPDGEVVAAARHVLGARGGDVRVTRDDRWVTVTVSAPFTAWPGADGLHARASATGWAEP